jgi:hypothetical protein
MFTSVIMNVDMKIIMDMFFRTEVNMTTTVQAIGVVAGTALLGRS